MYQEISQMHGLIIDIFCFLKASGRERVWKLSKRFLIGTYVSWKLFDRFDVYVRSCNLTYLRRENEEIFITIALLQNL